MITRTVYRADGSFYAYKDAATEPQDDGVAEDIQESAEAAIAAALHGI
jgi:hypothetical protein